MVFLLVLNPAYLSDAVVANYIPGLLTALGMTTQAAWFTDIAVRFVFDNIIIALCVIFVIIRIRHYAKIQTVLVGLSILGAILVPAGFLALGHDGFVAAINARSAIPYDAIITKARSLGFTPYFSWTDTILAVPSMALFLITNWPCSVGGELKSVRKSMSVGIIGAGVVSWIIFFVTAALYYWVLGPDFASSIAYLTVNSPADSPFGGANLLTSVLQYAYGLNWITFLITISLVAACVITAAQSILLITRHVLAWSFDGVIPSKFASVSDRFGTPVFTTLVVWVLSEIVLLVILFFSSAVGMMLNAAVGVLIGYTPALFAAMLFSSRRKELFGSSPSITRYKIGGVYAITVLGAIAGFGFLILLAFALAFPQIGYPATPTNIGFMIGFYLLALVVYYVGRAYRRQRGIDIELAFKQIPPE